MREQMIKLKLMNKINNIAIINKGTKNTATVYMRDRCEIKKSIFSTLLTGPAPARRYSGVNSNIGEVLVCNFVK